MENLSIPVDKNAKGLIFDCDGTLADTMGFHIEAAWQLKLHPADCQVFEDGEFGLKAARDAGMIATDIRLYL